MNSLLYYYNNVQKMSAYRQAKRMQCGVKLGKNQSVGGSTTAKFVSNPIPIGTDDFTVEFYGSMCGSNVSYASLFNAASPSAGGDRTFSFYSRYYPNNGIYGILFSPDTDGDSLGDQVVVQYEPGDDSKFLVSVTRQGTTVKVYINGELKATKEQSAVKDLGDLQLAIANSSDVGFVRVWNMCLSADDVTEHYNNGDPMGYVVPKTSRYFPDVSFLGPANDLFRQSFTWENLSSDINNFRYNFKQNPIVGQRLKIQVTVSDYEAGAIYLDAAFEGPYRFNSPITSNGIFTYISNKVYWSYTAYGRVWCEDIGQGRKCTVTVDSVEVVGLLAEYLPLNLMYGRDDKTIATSWLDSAKQLPLSDEYMEPLFQSIGGYDMTANGAPEILYNE